MEPIHVPKPTQKTDYQHVEFATEIAFHALQGEAGKLIPNVSLVAGLMYLRDQALTQEFREVCRKVLISLTPSGSHFIKDGGEHFDGEDRD